MLLEEKKGRLFERRGGFQGQRAQAKALDQE
jgi:hypothetical protein